MCVGGKFWVLGLVPPTDDVYIFSYPGVPPLFCCCCCSFIFFLPRKSYIYTFSYLHNIYISSSSIKLSSCLLPVFWLLLSLLLFIYLFCPERLNVFLLLYIFISSYYMIIIFIRLSSCLLLPRRYHHHHH